MKSLPIFKAYSRNERIVACILISLLFIHLTLKVMWMGVFMDELITFYNYVQPAKLFQLVSHLENPFEYPLSISARGIQQMSWYYCAYRTAENQPLTFYTDFPQLTADIILKEPNRYYEFIDLNWLRPKYEDATSKLHLSIPLHRVPKDATTLNVYLWNQDMVPFSIREGKCYLYELD